MCKFLPPTKHFVEGQPVTYGGTAHKIVVTVALAKARWRALHIGVVDSPDRVWGFLVSDLKDRKPYWTSSSLVEAYYL